MANVIRICAIAYRENDLPLAGCRKNTNSGNVRSTSSSQHFATCQRRKNAAGPSVNKVLRYFVQFCAFATFAVFVGYFSSSPAFHFARAESAVVKLSLSHATDRVAPCVLLTPKEIAALAPNMRRTESCERARLPLTVELEVDGKIVFSAQSLPAGLWGDGPASVYEKFNLPPGSYQMDVRLRDTARTEGWDYTLSKKVELIAGRYHSVTFKAETGGFKFR